MQFHKKCYIYEVVYSGEGQLEGTSVGLREKYSIEMQKSADLLYMDTTQTYPYVWVDMNQ